MNICIEEAPSVDISPLPNMPLWIVWIDTNMGDPTSEPDWEMNSAPQKLKPALAEASQLRADGWPAKILPEYDTPRADGNFTNPNHQ